jgi:hypothetical protein
MPSELVYSIKATHGLICKTKAGAVSYAGYIRHRNHARLSVTCVIFEHIKHVRVIIEPQLSLPRFSYQFPCIELNDVLLHINKTCSPDSITIHIY